MIVARYGADEMVSGAVAVLGPTRMPYSRNISAVRYVANLMNGFVNEYYLEMSQAPILTATNPTPISEE
jgi:transcriptional regulator of heat shock response